MIDEAAQVYLGRGSAPVGTAFTAEWVEHRPSGGCEVRIVGFGDEIGKGIGDRTSVRRKKLGRTGLEKAEKPMEATGAESVATLVWRNGLDIGVRPRGRYAGGGNPRPCPFRRG